MSNASGTGGTPELNGLSGYVAAVETARERLGQDLDQLTAEVRVQMAQTVQKTAWKGAASLAAILGAVLARKALTAGWKKARHADPPANPAAPGTTWPEAMAWAGASGLAIAVARLLATRGVAAGWHKATGALPPGLEEVTP